MKVMEMMIEEGETRVQVLDRMGKREPRMENKERV